MEKRKHEQRVLDTTLQEISATQWRHSKTLWSLNGHKKWRWCPTTSLARFPHIHISGP